MGYGHDAMRFQEMVSRIIVGSFSAAMAPKIFCEAGYGKHVKGLLCSSFRDRHSRFLFLSLISLNNYAKQSNFVMFKLFSLRFLEEELELKATLSEQI